MPTPFPQIQELPDNEDVALRGGYAELKKEDKRKGKEDFSKIEGKAKVNNNIGEQAAIKIIRDATKPKGGNAPAQRDLGLNSMELQSLNFVQTMKLYWANLEDVDVSNNLLSSIQPLQQYHQLKKIDASNNYIEVVNNLNLPHLETLNLQNNCLK